MTQPTTTTPGVTLSPSGKKSFIPLENNPHVFTTLMHTLGVSPSLSCHDIYTLDPSHLTSIPRPIHALVFISPASVYYRVRTKYDGYNPDKGAPTSYNRSGPTEPILWFRQTIGNACGLYSLIHAAGNGSTRSFVMQDSLLSNLLTSAEPLSQEPRAAVLYDSLELEQCHMAAAVTGDSAAPRSDEKVGYHFITFVRGRDGHLWELEGSWDPIDRGVLEDGEDLLGERAVGMGVGRFVGEARGEVGFSIVAVVGGGE